jgi:hypothetical protein
MSNDVEIGILPQGVSDVIAYDAIPAKTEFRFLILIRCTCDAKSCHEDKDWKNEAINTIPKKSKEVQETDL